MFTKILSVFFVLGLMGSAAYAQSGTSVGAQTYRGEYTMRDEVVSFSPQLGVVSYTNILVVAKLAVLPVSK